MNCNRISSSPYKKTGSLCFGVPPKNGWSLDWLVSKAKDRCRFGNLSRLWREWLGLPGPGDGLIVRTTWEAFVGAEWLLLVLPVATLRTRWLDSNLLWLAAHFILPPVGHIQMVNRELLKKAQYSSVAFWMTAEHPRIHTIPFSTILPDIVDILLDLLDQT